MIDTYLRVSLSELRSLHFKHLESAADPGAPEAAVPQDGAWFTESIEGYTEWISTAVRAHSVGWDWYAKVPEGVLAIREHSIRTNIMLIRDDGCDAGQQETLLALEALIKTWPWADVIQEALLHQ